MESVGSTTVALAADRRSVRSVLANCNPICCEGIAAPAHSRLRFWKRSHKAAIYGGERLGSYDVDRNILAIPNVIPAGDMNSDCALVKLMWALGQGGDVRSIMRTDLAGEISVPNTR